MFEELYAIIDCHEVCIVRLAVLSLIHRGIESVELIDSCFIHREDDLYCRIPQLLFSELSKFFLDLVVVWFQRVIDEDEGCSLNGYLGVVFVMKLNMIRLLTVHVAS